MSETRLPWIRSVLGTLTLASICAASAIAVPTASAQETWVNNVSVSWLMHNAQNDVDVALAASITCGSVGATQHVYILDDHLGAAADGIGRMLLSAFLAGRQIDVVVVPVTLGTNTYCAINRLRIR